MPRICADLLVQERGALELPPIADGGRDLAGEGDGPLAQVLLDPAARQAERQRGEAEGDDDEHGDAQEDELEPDAEAHRLRPLSRGGRSPGTRGATRASISPRRSSWQDTRRAAAACTVVMASPPRHRIQVCRAYRRAPEGSTIPVSVACLSVATRLGLRTLTGAHACAGSMTAVTRARPRSRPSDWRLAAGYDPSCIELAALLRTRGSHPSLSRGRSHGRRARRATAPSTARRRSIVRYALGAAVRHAGWVSSRGIAHRPR